MNLLLPEELVWITVKQIKGCSVDSTIVSRKAQMAFFPSSCTWRNFFFLSLKAASLLIHLSDNAVYSTQRNSMNREKRNRKGWGGVGGNTALLLQYSLTTNSPKILEILNFCHLSMIPKHATLVLDTVEFNKPFLLLWHNFTVFDFFYHAMGLHK